MKTQNSDTDNFFNSSLQQTWIHYSLLISLLLSVAVGVYFVSKQWYLLNILDAIVVPLLLTLIGSMQKYFKSYPFRRLLSFNLTMYIFGKVLMLSGILIQNEIYFGASLFLIAHIVYFTGEFLFDLYCHFSELTWNSFLINHSWHYGFAMFLCWLEYGLELYFYPSIKEMRNVIYVGVGMNVIGQIFRLGSFCSARSNFHHLVRYRRNEEHQLITSGIYRVSRHPSYFGWFLYSLSCQLFLVNPVCFILYIPIIWYFFYVRIVDEELALERFFGEDYVNYRLKVSSLIPLMDSCTQRRKDMITNQ